MRFAIAVLAYGVAGPDRARRRPVGEGAGRTAAWKLLKGPWFDNNLATLEVTDAGLRMWWATGKVEDGDQDRPRLVRVAELDID